ncbi:MAG: hypothetical protein LRZ98_00050 [Candidatus Pacebacteria bacterium]|nr:hypothetical protein [Candidatus Paceibacterota bacterium]
MNKKIIKNKTKEIGEFYVVATPIGNLNDISFRAIEVLNFVDFVLAEDTRISKKLFNKFNIDAKLISYNSFSSRNKKDKIIG